jgi:hypothetical protein
VRENLKYFKNSLVFTGAALALAAALGFLYDRSTLGALRFAFVACVLSVLEISLSFDNAVVNARVLRNMTPVWRRRFLTWGIAIAVFGMRLVFPLLIVGIVARVGPLGALRLAVLEPAEYLRILSDAHALIAGFGGAFLAMVALRYFFDVEKEVHWIRAVESPLTRVGRMEAVELAVVMVGLYFISRYLAAGERAGFLAAGIFGLVTYIVVDGISSLMEVGEETVASAHKASAAMFLYLEVLDASFSFDGVIGAFALTNNLFIIAIGLGSGAMFVRSLTLVLVEKGTLQTYKYLEHGAFYAIGALAVIMFLGTFRHIPEVITGCIGAGFIALALWSSIRHNRPSPAAELERSGGRSAELQER